MALATYPTFLEIFPADLLAASEALTTDRVTALILELPGCYSTALTEPQALNGLRVAVPDYYRWLSMQDIDTPTMSGEVGLAVAERYTVTSHGLHVVRGFFTPDAEPLEDEDLDWGLALMSYAHIDLMSLVQSLTAEQWQWQADPMHPTILQVIDNLAQNELWLATRLDATPHVPLVTELPGPPPARYDTIHEDVMLRLSNAPPTHRDAVREHNGERWSMRKMIRRSIQAEREATEQLAIQVAQWSSRH